MGRDITFLGHTRGRVTVFFAGNWGRAERNSPAKKKLYQPSLPLINDRSLICNVSRSVLSLVELQYALVSLGMYGLLNLCRMLLTSFSVLLSLLYKVL